MNRKTETDNGINPDEQFPLVERLLYRLAHDHTAQYRMTFDEAKSDAFLGFMKACRNYKPGKGTKFSTWCRMVTWGQMKSLRMDEARKYLELVELNEELVGEIPHEERSNPRVDAMHDRIHPRESLASVIIALFREAPREMFTVATTLSEDGKEMLALFAQAPREVAGDRRLQCRQVRDRFARRFGVERSNQAYREVRTMMMEAFA